MAMEERAVSPAAVWARRSVGTAVGLGGFAAALTVLSKSMRAVLDIGGSCATGGPYEVARPCPDGVPELLVGAVLGGLVATALYAVSLVPRGPSFLPLLWPAMFLTLGWNFVDRALDPPGGGGVVWGWLVAGAVFGVVGGVPLLAALRPSRLRRLTWGDDGPAGWRSIVPTAPFRPGSGPVDQVIVWMATTEPGDRRFAGTGTVNGTVKPDGAEAPDVVTRLERLSDLRRRGALSEAEFEAAKREVIEGR